ncbi:alpha-ribazole phosphatase [Aquimarina sp. ERC-38]|uniref:alpha-ribazole phosphatase n=1 Tax=Aquimarina sp. ERC-38 TaxID=2949996 RepID=UPI0022486877|nr:alpha-ribazole phosphatase [Aquimarina sp. ERC-38]UZO80777.1 alpha-ribazole phosphatase [Aquimarina sp. ERC-38]
MEIHLIRHTTPDIQKGICYGQSDIGVAATFSSEVKEIQKQIPLDASTVIYSSPLQRCMQLANSFGLPVIQDSRLREVNFGTWELQAWDAIPQNEMEPWMKNFVSVAPPSGESYEAVQKRVLASFTEILQSSSKSVIICTHASPLRIILSNLKEIPLKDSFSLTVAYGQVFKIQYADKKLTIID